MKRVSRPLVFLRILLCACIAVPGMFAAPVVAAPASASIAAAAQPLTQADDDRVPYDAPPSALLRANSLTGDYRIDALDSGWAWTGATVTYSFYSDAVFAGAYYGTETVKEVSAPVKANVRAIMAYYSEIMNVDFVEVTETPSTIGKIRIMDSSGPTGGVLAYAYYPADPVTMFALSGDVHLRTSNDVVPPVLSDDFTNPPGIRGYEVLIHEIGHALGLKHPFEASGSSTVILPTAEDYIGNTVMTYTITGDHAATPMGYDELALRHIYGARSFNSANPYAFSIPDRFSRDGVLKWTSSHLNMRQLLHDTGPVSLDCSASTYASATIDMRPGGWITSSSYPADDVLNGTRLSFATLARDVRLGAGNENLYLNSAVNVVSGCPSGTPSTTDTIYFAEATDIIDMRPLTPVDVTSSTVGADRVLSLYNGNKVVIVGGATTMPIINYDAPHDSTLTIAASRNNPNPSIDFYLTGTLGSADGPVVGGMVTVQADSGTGWVTLASATTTGSGGYRVATRASVPTSYRAVFAAGQMHLGSTSGIVSVVPTVPPTVLTLSSETTNPAPGDAYRVKGSLTTTEFGAVDRAVVWIDRFSPSSGWTTATALTTDPYGRFDFWSSTSSTEQFRARFTGLEGFRASQSETVTVQSRLVPSSLTLSAANPTPDPDTDFMLIGSLGSARGATGLRLVTIEKWNGTSWSEAARSFTLADGTFSAVLRASGAAVYRAYFAGTSPVDSISSSAVVVTPVGSPPPSLPVGPGASVSACAIAVDASEPAPGQTLHMSVSAIEPSTGVSPSGVFVVSRRAAGASAWTPIAWRTAAGATVFDVVAPDTAADYKVAFLSDAEHYGSESTSVRVTPLVTFGSLKASRSSKLKYRISGTIAPSGAPPVRLYKYKLVAGNWVPKGYSTATGTGTSFAATVKFSSAGTWKVRAYHAADTLNASTWAATSLTVKAK
jgi:hypothetical protein